MMKRLRTSLCLAAVGCCASSACGADPWQKDKASGCRLQTPESWKSTSVRWTGACVAGVAEGLGVLKAASDKKSQQLYFGRLHDGHLELGVIEVENGYVAGRFDNGKLTTDGNRETYVQAFREAVRAAKQSSDFYRSQHNAPSAKFYAAKAKELDQQLD